MPAVFRPRRSLLYMPASNPRALDKARSLPADGLIIDLEDAVAAETKEGARTIAGRHWQPVDTVRARSCCA
jgi:citrate lyase subunit beta / citryl-CoA lyase